MTPPARMTRRTPILAPQGTPVKRGARAGTAAIDGEAPPPDPSMDEYLTHLQVERRLAVHTIESYSRDLGRLAREPLSRRSAREPRAT